ncbi:hypothetical protein WUBG_17037 [Wuchereria bancrofti]|uniref:Uncharacterized protein n=1 Tax=Wuchereria bancrofti TaxID=6293 RepID=J9ADJ9_WUCBA|nr:hypothetical protein WUBG_17037 [Wuchereria bancrofti]VDM22389.1 unnamed protein product [Wuchereria bancrofti]
MSSNVTISDVTNSLTSALSSVIVENFRNKRQLWHDYNYNSYYGYGFHWHRIILSILFLLALFLCCLVPCICALGIWLAGWFGLRNRAARKRNINLPVANTQQQQQQQQPVIPPQGNPTSAAPGNSRERIDSYIYEERRGDRFYHRPPPPNDDYRRHFTSSKL